MKTDLIIIFYNHEKIVNPAIMLLAKSSHLFNKIFLVNNGSQDNTLKILTSEREKIKNGYIVDLNNNLHIGGSIKKALSLSKSDFVGWVHGDIFIQANDYQKMISILSENKDSAILFKVLRKNRRLKEYIFTLFLSLYASLVMQLRLYDLSAIPVFISKDIKKFISRSPDDYTFDLFIYAFCKKKEIKIRRFYVEDFNKIVVSNWSRSFSGYLKMIIIWLKAVWKIKNEIK